MKIMWWYNKWARDGLKIITPVNVIKETQYFVLVEGARYRTSKEGEFFNSFQDAKNFVIKKYNDAITYQETQLAKNKAELAMVEALSE